MSNEIIFTSIFSLPPPDKGKAKMTKDVSEPVIAVGPQVFFPPPPRASELYALPPPVFERRRSDPAEENPGRVTYSSPEREAEMDRLQNMVSNIDSIADLIPIFARVSELEDEERMDRIRHQRALRSLLIDSASKRLPELASAIEDFGRHSMTEILDWRRRGTENVVVDPDSWREEESVEYPNTMEFHELMSDNEESVEYSNNMVFHELVSEDEGDTDTDVIGAIKPLRTVSFESYFDDDDDYDDDDSDYEDFEDVPGPRTTTSLPPRLPRERVFL